MHVSEEIISDSCPNASNSSDVSLHSCMSVTLCESAPSSPTRAAITEIESITNDKIVCEKVMMQEAAPAQTIMSTTSDGGDNNVDFLDDDDKMQHMCDKNNVNEVCVEADNKSTTTSTATVAKSLLIELVEKAVTFVIAKKLEARHSWHMTEHHNPLVKEDEVMPL